MYESKPVLYINVIKAKFTSVYVCLFICIIFQKTVALTVMSFVLLFYSYIVLSALSHVFEAISRSYIYFVFKKSRKYISR